MTRSEFSRKVAKKMQTDVVEAKLWVMVIFDTLSDEIMTHDKVNIMNFGTFKRKIKQPKRRMDCNTGEIVVDPEKTMVTFSPSEYLKYRAAEEAPLEE